VLAIGAGGDAPRIDDADDPLLRAVTPLDALNRIRDIRCVARMGKEKGRIYRPSSLIRSEC
jgi:hypothetical protein